MKKISIIIFLTVAGCGIKDRDTVQTSIAPKAAMPDELFAFKNISNCLFVEKFHYYDTPKDLTLYSDTTKKIAFVALDSLQKLRLIAPALKDLTTDSFSIAKLMNAYFISKQDKIGDYTPIITWISGDDYQSLTLLVLDSTNKVKSHFILHGGFNAGPSDVNDSIQLFPTLKHSVINGNKISSYELKVYMRVNSPEKPSIIDSISYISNITSTGQIETKRIDSIRTERVYNW